MVLTVNRVAEIIPTFIRKQSSRTRDILWVVGTIGDMSVATGHPT